MTDLVFQGNMARAVGFDDSNAVAGPAVSNLGTISEMTNMTFIDNTFYCSEGTYVDYIQVNLNTGVCSNQAATMILQNILRSSCFVTSNRASLAAHVSARAQGHLAGISNLLG